MHESITTDYNIDQNHFNQKTANVFLNGSSYVHLPKLISAMENIVHINIAKS